MLPAVVSVTVEVDIYTHGLIDFVGGEGEVAGTGTHCGHYEPYDVGNLSAYFWSTETVVFNVAVIVEHDTASGHIAPLVCEGIKIIC